MLIGLCLGVIMLMLLWAAVEIFKLFVELFPLWIILFMVGIVLYIIH